MFRNDKITNHMMENIKNEMKNILHFSYCKSDLQIIFKLCLSLFFQIASHTQET